MSLFERYFLSLLYPLLFYFVIIFNCCALKKERNVHFVALLLIIF